ncbi:MAG: DNA-protecting protein DprA [Gammaproteobacteria bacterium]|nr:DNA-protecting protein DprA [Gammaproteobacteria bacterium]
MDDLRTAAVLGRAPRLAAATLRALAGQGGRPEELLRMRRAELHALGVHEETAQALLAPDDAAIAADVAWLEKTTDVHPLLAHEDAYPPLLAEIRDAPPVLFVRGSIAALSSPQLAIVGSRNPTTTGRSTAREFARWFAEAGLTITSGLALGIDAASHAGALAGGGLTVAVCGTGLDSVYPPENAALAERIVASGALVSELPPRSPPLRHHFPRRNRLISGLAHGVLVVEAARGSGSLHTARAAGEQGREVFAIPGSIHSPLSRGCHKLIREGAKLVEEAADVLAELKISLISQSLAHAGRPPDPTSPQSDELDKDYKILLDALGFEPAGIDSLVERTSLPSESVASMLLILELEGRVEPRPGGRYCRTPPAT